jgi:hypothetical protein
VDAGLRVPADDLAALDRLAAGVRAASPLPSRLTRLRPMIDLRNQASATARRYRRSAGEARLRLAQLRPAGEEERCVANAA